MQTPGRGFGSKQMKIYLRWLQKFESAVMIIAFITMMIASFAQVINRNLIHASIGWFEELARYSMIYMTLLATEMGLRDDTQMSITAVTDKLKGNTKKVIQIIAKTLVVFFSATVFCNSFVLLYAQFSFGQSSPGLGIPMYIPYFALPFSFGIITLVQTAMLVILILTPLPAKEKQKEGTA